MRAGAASAWQNSILLRGDAVDIAAELKAPPGDNLSINGRAALVGNLHATGLIDRYTLLIHPLTLGSGRRLVDDPVQTSDEWVSISRRRRRRAG